MGSSLTVRFRPSRSKRYPLALEIAQQAPQQARVIGCEPRDPVAIYDMVAAMGQQGLLDSAPE